MQMYSSSKPINYHLNSVPLILVQTVRAPRLIEIKGKVLQIRQKQKN